MTKVTINNIIPRRRTDRNGIVTNVIVSTGQPAVIPDRARKPRHDNAAKISGIALFKRKALSRKLLLRLGTYMLDCFVSQGWCRPFINPAGEYVGAVSKFYGDLAQIIYNAFKFHEKDSVIFKEADSMLTCFVNLTTKFSKPPHDINKLDFVLAQIGAKLPHEEFGDVCKVVPNINIKSKIYIVPLYSFLQVTRSGSNVAKLPYAAAERLDPMSSSLFDTFERESLPPVKFQPTETHCNFARLYITKGTKNIKKCRDERNAILVIVKDVSYEVSENRLRCNVDHFKTIWRAT
ncbi:unnamed protein product [Rhizophagus irregularis]|nr:unnamed protein product [Rhizophagus irregularis]